MVMDFESSELGRRPSGAKMQKPRKQPTGTIANVFDSETTTGQFLHVTFVWVSLGVYNKSPLKRRAERRKSQKLNSRRASPHRKTEKGMM